MATAVALPSGFGLPGSGMAGSSLKPAMGTEAHDLVERVRATQIAGDELLQKGDLQETKQTRRIIPLTLVRRPSKIPEAIWPQIRELNTTLQLISEQRLQPKLPSFYQSVSAIEMYYTDLDKLLDQRRKRFTWKPQDDWDERLKIIMSNLKNEQTKLEDRSDVQIASIMSRIDSKPASQKYCNADFRRFFKDEIIGWKTTKTNIYVQPTRTAAELTLRNLDDEEVHINYMLTSSFQEALEALEAYLSGFSLPVARVFPTKSQDLSSASSGEVRLDTEPNSATPIRLWVYHNVFFRINWTASQSSSSTPKKTPETAQDRLAQRLRDHVKLGTVGSQGSVIRPKIGTLRAPGNVTAGENFNAEITIDPQTFHSVICKSDNLVYADYKDSDKTRTYSFLATGPGDGEIDLCFAHPNTLNVAHLPISVRVEAAKEKKKRRDLSYSPLAVESRSADLSKQKRRPRHG